MWKTFVLAVMILFADHASSADCYRWKDNGSGGKDWVSATCSEQPSNDTIQCFQLIASSPPGGANNLRPTWCLTDKAARKLAESVSTVNAPEVTYVEPARPIADQNQPLSSPEISQEPTASPTESSLSDTAAFGVLFGVVVILLLIVGKVWKWIHK
jgi:hypothetical protein